MSEASRTPAPLLARLHALWRGRELAGEVSVAAHDDAVRLALRAPRAELLVLPYASLDGVTFDGATLALHEARGDVLELTGDAALGALAARIEAEACSLPEQTLALRGFASERSAPGSDHDRWFAALLTARAACAAERTLAGQVAAFDAPALARHARATCAASTGRPSRRSILSLTVPSLTRSVPTTRMSPRMGRSVTLRTIVASGGVPSCTRHPTCTSLNCPVP